VLAGRAARRRDVGVVRSVSSAWWRRTGAPAGRPRTRRVLWPSALCGALLLLMADVLTRLLPFDQELKLGVLTGLVGTPFFIALVLRLKRVAP
jgi:ABC-type cobalamin transport system permease subunit